MGSTEVRFPGLGWKVNISEVAFSIGKFDVYWYGVIIAAAMILCIVLGTRDCKKNKFSQDFLYDCLLVALPSAIIGARLYYVIFKWDYYAEDLKRIFDTRSGGLAVYGGLIGAFLGTYIMCRIRKAPFTTVIDYVIPYIPLGQAIGRWGNFFNQEAFGTTTLLPWGMQSDVIHRYLAVNCPTLDPTMPVHPTFFYESVFNVILFFILLQVRKNSKYALETTSIYCIGYGVVRFLIEGLRTDSLYIAGTSARASQVLSLVLVVFGLLCIAYVHAQVKLRVELPEKLFVDREAKVESEVEAEVETETPAEETPAEEKTEEPAEAEKEESDK